MKLTNWKLTNWHHEISNDKGERVAIAETRKIAATAIEAAKG